MDIISLIFSIIAVIISVVVAILEWNRDYNINRINLESVYFQDIYKEHLVYEIPSARGYIKFNTTNELIGTDKLISELQKLRRDSLYFQYNAPEFYEELKKDVQNLENYLVSNTNRIFIGEEQVAVYGEIRKGIESIYKVISNGYLGK